MRGNQRRNRWQLKEARAEKAREERCQKVFDLLSKVAGETLDKYEEERPDWWVETLLRLLYEGVYSLRGYLQDPESGVTWAEPFVELQYPIEWDFDRSQEGGAPILFTATADELEGVETDETTRRAVTERLAHSVSETVRLRVLEDLTNHCGWFVQKDTWYPLLPQSQAEEWDLRDELRALPEEEKNAELERLLRPFFIGPAKWWHRPTVEELQETLSEAEGVNPTAVAALTEEDVDDLEAGLWDEASEAASVPAVTIEVQRDEGTAKVSLAAAFHPFVVNYDERQAFYPVVVGLVFEGEGADPETWDNEERDNLLALLLEAFDHAEVEDSEKEPADEEPQPVVVPPPPERRPFPLSFGVTRADRRALDFANNLHQLRLPKRWANIPRWDELVADEIKRLRDDGRDDRLLQRVGRDGREAVRLTKKAELELRVRSGLGSAGFREVHQRNGREYLVRLVSTGAGFLEVGLSWWGLAGPLVDEWVQDARKETERARLEATQLVLFEDLAEERRIRLDAMLARVRCCDYGRKILEAVLGQVGRQAQNPVVVPASALRVLLGLEEDEDWKAALEGGLDGLRGLESRLCTYGTGAEVYGYGNALPSWTYVGRGPGDHADGDYYLELGRQFLGCLQAFESNSTTLRKGMKAATYDWSREVPAEERGALGWSPKSRAAGTEPERFHVFDAGTPFYNAAEGLTPYQENLVRFLERELTLRRDTAAKNPDTGRPWTRKVRADAGGANEPRVYDGTFCPLLSEGRYHAALGHFKKNPENSRTLGGTPRRGGTSGGAHHGGLLHEMGYLLEPGGATEQRRETVQAALEDLRAVVVDYLGGVVVARGPDGAWLTAEAAQGLPWDTLVHRVRWFLFLPETWKDDRKRRWEEKTGYRATEDEVEARRVREARWAGEEAEEALSSPVGASVGTGGLPLYMRLHVTMKERRLTLQAVGDLFGVSKQAVSLWFKGTEPDPDTGAVKGKPIPAELRPLVERWVATGEPPTAEDLAARRTRRAGRREP